MLSDSEDDDYLNSTKEKEIMNKMYNLRTNQKQMICTYHNNDTSIFTIKGIKENLFFNHYIYSAKYRFWHHLILTSETKIYVFDIRYEKIIYEDDIERIKKEIEKIFHRKNIKISNFFTLNENTLCFTISEGSYFNRQGILNYKEKSIKVLPDSFTNLLSVKNNHIYYSIIPYQKISLINININIYNIENNSYDQIECECVEGLSDILSNIYKKSSGFTSYPIFPGRTINEDVIFSLYGINFRYSNLSSIKFIFYMYYSFTTKTKKRLVIYESSKEIELEGYLFKKGINIFYNEFENNFEYKDLIIFKDILAGERNKRVFFFKEKEGKVDITIYQIPEQISYMSSKVYMTLNRNNPKFVYLLDATYNTRFREIPYRNKINIIEKINKEGKDIFTFKETDIGLWSRYTHNKFNAKVRKIVITIYLCLLRKCEEGLFPRDLIEVIIEYYINSFIEEYIPKN